VLCTDRPGPTTTCGQVVITCTERLIDTLTTIAETA